MNKLYSLTFALTLIAVSVFAQSKNPADYKTHTTGFYENKGQIVDQNYNPNPAVKYLFNGNGLNVQLRGTGFSYDTYTDTPDKTSEEKWDPILTGKPQALPSINRHFHRIDIELVGCNTAAPMLAEDKSEAYYNYFTSGTPQGGVSEVHTYQKVTYKNIYPNIDLTFFVTASPHEEGKSGVASVEYNFIIHPGGDYRQIKLQYKGADGIKLLAGEILIPTSNGDVKENIPASYLADTKQPVQVNYIAFDNSTFGFLVPTPHKGGWGADLIIDPNPCITWGTYYGGTGNDEAYALAVDAGGNAYITGATTSLANMATAGAYRTGYFAAQDIYVAKFNSTGTSLVWGTYYGGNKTEQGMAIRVDASNNVYITGSTQSLSQIATAGAYQTAMTGVENVFVAKFNSTGTSLLWGTYYGGTATDDGLGIVLDASDNVYITGVATSTTGIATAGAYQTVFAGNQDVFLAEINSTGTALVWGTYYGGVGNDQSHGIVMDATGNLYIAGYTGSTANIATAGAYQTVNNGGGWDVLVAKFNSTGTSLLWGTYYGGANQETGLALAIDASDNVYVTGIAGSPTNTATVGAYQTVYAGAADAFVAKFDPTGSTLLWGTYYGGTQSEQGNGIAVDASGNVYVTGYTVSSTAIATAGAYQTTYGGGPHDLFIAKFDPTGSSLIWGTYYGGTGDEVNYGMALDASNNVYVSGYSGGNNGIATAGSYQTALGGGFSDAFVAKFGCTGPAPLSTTASQTNVKCFGTCTGTATANASGGTSPYTYSWAPGGQTTVTITGLCASTYTCTVTDAVAATATVSVTITQPPVLTASTTINSNVLCNGGSTGKATANPGGGTGAYTYSWAPSGGTNAIASNLTAGTYTVTITDANSCTATASATITQPPTLTASTGSITNVNCNGGATGSATATAGGGTGAYTYNWTPSGGTNATASNRTAGTYTVTIKDANNCSATASAVITQPPVLTASTGSLIHVKCNGGATGSATATAGGGTGAYTYNWTPSGGTNATASNLTAGTYTITITDANNCTATASATITQAPLLTVSTTVNTNVSCNGASTGKITATPGGGTGAYTYSWAPSGGTGAIASNLTAGTYTITVTDANNCTATASATITQPPLLTVSATVNTNVLCNGGSTGKITATPGGGTGAYTYAWTPSGGTNAIASNLTAGTYTITVKDANNCSATASATITQPTLLTVTTTVNSNVLCNGGNTGKITSNPSGGSGAYTYNWTPSGGTNASASNLTAGTYTITITDNNGCTATASATITQPTSLTVTTTVNSNVLCNGGSTGKITSNPSGGTAAYTYSWSNGATTAAASNLTAGSYTITVTDNNGCSATASATITQPSVLTASTGSITNVKCNGGATGSATATAGGGTGVYTYNWTPSGGTNATASNLTAGTYTVTITDANNCSATATAVLTQPSSLTAPTSTNPATCGNSNGSSTVTAGGGTGAYTYSWAPSGGTNATASNISAGSYTVTVTDANGCTITASASVSNIGGESASISSITNILCNGGNNGSVTVNATGGTPPYTYNWTPVGGTNATANNLTAGTYTVTVKDNNGCTATASATVSEPTLLTVGTTVNGNVLCNGGNNGSITANPNGGTAAYTYSWSNGTTNATASNLTAGSYTITVTDNNGCGATATASISEPAVLTGTPNANPNTICVGDSSTISVTSGGGTPSYTYSWNNGATTSSVLVKPITTTVYTVTTTDANGCTQITVVTVGVNALPTVTLTAAMDTQCVITSSDLLTGNPSGGTYSGVGVTGNNFDASAAGVGNHTVTYTYTDGNGCTSSDSIVINVDICAGIGTTTLNNQIKFYPNPFSQSINVDNNTTEQVTITMFNMMGQQMGTWQLDKGLDTISTETYPTGVYMLQVKTKDGVLNKKLIKVN